MATKDGRNKQIYEDRLKGLTFVEIGEKYGISKNCARLLFVQEQRYEERKQNKLYQLICSLSDNQEFVTRTYNVMVRNNIATKEAILNVTRKELLTYRNCGKAMIDLIMKMADILRKEDIELA
jgi:DNA-directed RNA polymerase alpha subunit